MILGIDCSRSFSLQPTGVEIYTDHIIDALVSQADHLGYDEVRLYIKTEIQGQKLKAILEASGQKKGTIVLIDRARLWTFFWLSIELFRHPIDALFIPSHTVPLIVPKISFLTVHGVEALSFPEAYRLWHLIYHQFSLWWAKWKGTKFIAVSEWVKQDLMNFFKIDKKRIMVIYHGFERRAKKKEEEEKKEFVEGDTIVCIGRLERRKNQLRLLQAFESIANEYKKIQLVLVGGDGNGAKEIKEKVEHSPFKDRVYLAGYQDRVMVQQLLEKALIFAYPSLAEGFGMPILEAFDAGVPVLTSKGSATEEIGGDAAMYCDPISAESIAQGLKFYLADPALRQEKIRLGKKRSEEFSWEKCLEETKKVLLRVS